MKKLKIIAVLIGFLTVHTSFSQGDDCSTALQLTTLNDYCSSGGLYTNATATAPAATGYAQATCWTNASQNFDVWFKFVSVGTDIMITVKGAGLSTGATLSQASIALYSGDCATGITEHKCSMSTTTNLTSLYQGAMVLAKTYYIRVTTTTANRGKFDLCINNFNPVQNPNSPNDCDKGTIICNKDVVSVGLLDSYGSNTTEHKLLNSCMDSDEANSTWLEFKCSTSGTLDFDLAGTDNTNDLDWILMEIPALRSCATRTLVSCNIASCDINKAESTSGVERKTGLRGGEDAAALNGSGTTKDSEGRGCSTKANGYNNTVNITAGKTYALFINNFTGVQGFAIAWGGTSKFQGPEPAITVDKTTICIGESIQASGATSTAGTYTSLEWTMPSVGVPTTYSGVGPFPVTFNKTGTYPLILKGLDAEGCINVVNKNITVNGINADFTAPPVCVGTATTFTCPTVGITSYSWDFGDGASGSGASTTHTYAKAGDYTAKLTITGGSCTNVFSQNVSVLGADLGITPASPSICNGNSVTLNGTAKVTGNVSKSKVFTQSTLTTVPPTNGYSVGVDSNWDGSIGTGTNAASASDVGISNLVVSGLTSSSWKINSVCINITTSKPKHDMIYLENPCGQRIKLVDFTNALTNTTPVNPAFSNACFTPTATTILGSTANAPFSGTYAADEITKWNSNLLNCSNPNGTWKLLVGENIFGSSGASKIVSWSIDFQTDAPNSLKTLVWSPLTNLTGVGYTGIATATGTATATTSSAGTIALNATDENNCASTKSVTITVGGATPPTTATVNYCQGATASALTATGTNLLWYTDASTGTGSATAPTPSTSSVGTTHYWVSQTTGGCESTRAPLDVIVAAKPTITVNSPTICAGQSATLTASGGTTYSWTGGSTTNPYSVSPTATTTYTVTGTTSGCSNTATATVTVYAIPTITVNSPTICAGQTATLTASGGTTYAWTGGPTTATYSVTPSAASTTYTVTGTTSGCSNTATATVTIASGLAITVNSPTICAGQSATLTAAGGTNYTWTGGATTNPYTVSPTTTTSYTVTGETNGCTGTATATVTVNAVPTITVNSPTICAGQTATLTANGGTTYSWTGGSTTNPYSVSPSATTSYTVTGTTSGCSNTATATVTVNTVPTITVNSPTICAGQTATLTASGGTTYAWTGGPTTANYDVTPTAATTTYTVTGTTSGCSNTATATVTIASGLAITVNSPTICAGESATLTAAGGTNYTWTGGATTNPYTVSPTTTTSYTVTGETNGCTGTATATVTVNTIPTITVNSPTICAGQSATLTANGGTTYSWTGGSTTNPYSVSPTATTSYTVTGTTSGCSNTATATVTVNAVPTITVNSPTICAGQTATLTAAGGTTYSWTGGSTTNPYSVSPSATTSYTVTGTTNGCSNTATATVTIASGLAITVNSPTICAGQSATLTASGGTNYTWTGGATTNPYTVSPSVTTSYTVTGETGGCTGTAIATVTVVTIPTITVNSPTICSGQSATLTANGGTTYSWTGGSTTNPLTVSPTAASTTYTVTGTTSGCSSTATATVTVNPTPTITVNSPTICGGETATLTASGGTTYSWTGGSTTNPFTVSPASTTSYTVTGTTNGCSNTATANVVVNFTPILTVNSPIICRGESATLIASGGTTYLWSDGVTTSNNTVSPITTTNYTVTSNNGGCTSSATTTVTVNSSPTLIVSNPAEVCQPETVDITDPKLIIGSSTGTIITYCSNNTGTTLLTSPNSIRNSGTYYIKSTENGCSTIVPIIVKVNPKPKANFVPTPPNVTTINSKSVMLNTSLNAVDYSWIFSDGIVSSDVSPEHEFPNTEQSKQVAILIATSDAGCKDTTNKIINVNEEVIYYVPNTFTPDNDDFNQVFKPVFTSGYDPFSYHLSIFNRWGELVFESFDSTIGWTGFYGKDGVVVQEGSYTWKIDFKLKENDAHKIEVGSVNILK